MIYFWMEGMKVAVLSAQVYSAHENTQENLLKNKKFPFPH